MAYIGSTPTTQSFVAGTDYFNGTGSQVAFTLSRSVNSVNDIEVIVNNVEQIPSGYLVSGTTLTFSAAPSSGTSNVYVRYLSTTNLSLAIPAGTSATFNTVTATSLTATTLAATNLSYSGTLTGAAATFSGIVAANGGGIQFPATAVPSANANTLDDYEEGTFTPTFSPVTGSFTSVSTSGAYIKVGRTVTIFMSLTTTNLGSSSGLWNFSGLPFTSFNPSIGAGNRAAVGVVREDSAVGQINQIIINGNSTVGIVASLSNNAVTPQGNGYVYEISVQYIAAS